MKQIAIRVKELAFLSENPPQIIESFLSACDIRNSSKNTYRRQLMQFIYYLRENHITTPKRETILNFKAHLLKKELSPLTINSYLVALRNFFTYLESKSLYPNIAKNINSCPTTSFFVKEPLTVNQIEELLKSIDTTSVCGKRDYCILNLMVRAGLRSVEIVRANIGDIRNYNGDVLLYVQGKGKESKDEFVLLTEKALSPILEYLSERENISHSAPLFVSESNRNKKGRLTTRSIRAIAKKQLREIGLDDYRFSAHSLRHTFGTLALKNGAPIMQVKEALRHKDISTTMVYLHLMNRLEDAAERYIDF